MSAAQRATPPALSLTELAAIQTIAASHRETFRLAFHGIAQATDDATAITSADRLANAYTNMLDALTECEPKLRHYVDTRRAEIRRNIAPKGLDR